MRKAFTLIELLVSMGLLVVFLTILSQVLFTILDTQTTSGSVAYVETDAQYIINRMYYDKTLNDYVWTNQNLTHKGVRLNGPDTKVTVFAKTNIENTTKVNFTLVSGEETRSYQTTVGIR